MSLNNSFDFSEFEKLNHRPKVPEEDISSLTDIYAIACKLLFRSVAVVLPYLLALCFHAGLIYYSSSANFNSESFWVAVANNDIAYIQAITQSVLTIFAVNLMFVMVTTLTDNIFYAGIAGNSKGTNIGKFRTIFQIFLTKFFPILFVVIFKSILIMIGLMMFIVPGVMIWTSMLLIEYVIIFENKGFIDSWKRSNELMEGCKGNFITFLSIASLLIIPIYLAKVFYNFDTESTALFEGGSISLALIISLVIEILNYALYGAYYCGTCLLYMKRTRIFNELEREKNDAK